LSHCRFIYCNSHMGWSGIEPGLWQWEFCTWQSEPQYRPMKLLLLLFTYLFNYLLTYLLQWSCHLVAVILTLVQTKQIRINIHKRNNTINQSTNNTK
jgi:hypothetical protein